MISHVLVSTLIKSGVVNNQLFFTDSDSDLFPVYGHKMRINMKKIVNRKAKTKAKAKAETYFDRNGTDCAIVDFSQKCYIRFWHSKLRVWHIDRKNHVVHFGRISVYW